MSGSVKVNRAWNLAISHTENFMETETETVVSKIKIQMCFLINNVAFNLVTYSVVFYIASDFT